MTIHIGEQHAHGVTARCNQTIGSDGGVMMHPPEADCDTCIALWRRDRAAARIELLRIVARQLDDLSDDAGAMDHVLRVLWSAADTERMLYEAACTNVAPPMGLTCWEQLEVPEIEILTGEA